MSQMAKSIRGVAQKRSVWLWPVALNLLMTTGLLSALVSDGWGDRWSWLALAVPNVVILRFALWAR